MVGDANYVGVYFPFSSLFIGEGRVWKMFEDSPWVSRWVICTFQGQYYTINWKHERRKHTKTKAHHKNISCWFICGFIFLYFSSEMAIWNFDWVFSVKPVWWNKTCIYFLKIGSNKSVSNFVVYIIKFI